MFYRCYNLNANFTCSDGASSKAEYTESRQSRFSDCAWIGPGFASKSNQIIRSWSSADPLLLCSTRAYSLQARTTMSNTALSMRLVVIWLSIRTTTMWALIFCFLFSELHNLLQELRQSIHRAAGGLGSNSSLFLRRAGAWIPYYFLDLVVSVLLCFYDFCGLYPRK